MLVPIPFVYALIFSHLLWDGFGLFTQMLATNRLSELEEAQEENLSLSKQLEDLQVYDSELRYV